MVSFTAERYFLRILLACCGKLRRLPRLSDRYVRCGSVTGSQDLSVGFVTASRPHQFLCCVLVNALLSMTACMKTGCAVQLACMCMQSKACMPYFQEPDTWRFVQKASTAQHSTAWLGPCRTMLFAWPRGLTTVGIERLTTCYFHRLAVKQYFLVAIVSTAHHSMCSTVHFDCLS